MYLCMSRHTRTMPYIYIYVMTYITYNMSNRIFSGIANMITPPTMLFSTSTITMTKQVVAFKDPKHCEGILLECGIK
jgi:hypothetical protein